MHEMAHSASLHLPISEDKWELFCKETTKDPTLKIVNEMHNIGWLTFNTVQREVSHYYNLQRGMLFLSHKIIVPRTLWYTVLKWVREGHIGIEKSTAQAQLFYLPGITYESFKRANYKEPLLSHSVLELPYLKVGADILEFLGRAYLVLIDYFSHWIDIWPIASKISKSIIKAKQDIFNSHSFPKDLIADNLVISSPYYHHSNGMVEKVVGISKNILHKSQAEGTSVPVSKETLKPAVQTDIYKLLCAKKLKEIKLHDKSAKRTETVFQQGDRVVSKIETADQSELGLIVRKCRDLRSYWILRDRDEIEVRWNTYHMRDTKTHPTCAKG
ncbi:hypothetical protein PR048_013888 [Dryococelus australis]|uniref:Uncharacterized protein n=1 Tax=Dryococelus australis TaxID=614101 RepID=A0ABQ9HTE6_9NEOP|nr:hypothetical protein PR048_013888 [Dryococelus australis]